MPLVSVVIATYRRPDALVRAIKSVLEQTIPDFEVLVVAEQGDTATPVAVQRSRDARVRTIVNPEKKDGPGPARDVGALQSKGQWVAFLDDDDEWLPNKLEQQLAAAAGLTDVLVMTLSFVETSHGVFTRPSRPYSAAAEPIDEWLFDRHSWLKGGESMLQTSSLMVPQALFHKLRFGNVRHEEWEFAIRALKQFHYRLVTVNEPLVVYRAGNIYPWERSLEWVESVRSILTRRAYSGFCLTTATKGLPSKGRSAIFIKLLKMALRHGSPTMRQIFAFTMIWAINDDIRQQLRSRVLKR